MKMININNYISEKLKISKTSAYDVTDNELCDLLKVFCKDKLKLKNFSIQKNPTKGSIELTANEKSPVNLYNICKELDEYLKSINVKAELSKYEFLSIFSINIMLKESSISEKLHIGKNAVFYQYFPKDKSELKELVDKLIKEHGNNVDLNNIDTSEITDMSFMFYKSDFNGDISKWDVSKVKDMRYMFYESKFNGNISEWDVSKVTDMSCMFQECNDFNGDLSKWDVSKVIHMTFMFCNSNFNGDISKWNVVSLKKMTAMFLNSPLEKNTPKWYHD